MTDAKETLSALACAIVLCVGTAAWAQESSPIYCWRLGGCDGPNVTGFGTGNATMPLPTGNIVSCPDGYEMVWRYNMRPACAKEVIDAK